MAGVLPPPCCVGEVSSWALFPATHGGHHFNGHISRFVTLVGVIGSRASSGLLDVLHGEHAKADGDERFELHLHNAFGAWARNLFKMCGITTNHRAECDQRVVFT